MVLPCFPVFPGVFPTKCHFVKFSDGQTDAQAEELVLYVLGTKGLFAA